MRKGNALATLLSLVWPTLSCNKVVVAPKKSETAIYEELKSNGPYADDDCSQSASINITVTLLGPVPYPKLAYKDLDPSGSPTGIDRENQAACPGHNVIWTVSAEKGSKLTITGFTVRFKRYLKTSPFEKPSALDTPEDGPIEGSGAHGTFQAGRQVRSKALFDMVEYPIAITYTDGTQNYLILDDPMIIVKGGTGGM